MENNPATQNSTRALLPAHESYELIVVPDGRYRVQVTTTQAKTTPTSNKRYVMMCFTVEDGEWQGARIYGVVLPGFWLGQMAIAALGLTTVEDDCDAIAVMALQRRVGVAVRAREVLGLTHVEIYRYLGWGEV